MVHFDQVWQANHPYFDLQGKRRRIEKFSEHASTGLKGSAQKLFFVLVYLKENPTQVYHAALFSMSQGKPVAHFDLESLNQFDLYIHTFIFTALGA
ncbi:hypothetical protein BH24BAC1_BH24BAC1_35270 [soil metagenome]